MAQNSTFLHADTAGQGLQALPRADQRRPCRAARSPTSKLYASAALETSSIAHLMPGLLDRHSCRKTAGKVPALTWCRPTHSWKTFHTSVRPEQQGEKAIRSNKRRRSSTPARHQRRKAHAWSSTPTRRRRLSAGGGHSLAQVDRSPPRRISDSGEFFQMNRRRLQGVAGLSSCERDSCERDTTLKGE